MTKVVFQFWKTAKLVNELVVLELVGHQLEKKCSSCGRQMPETISYGPDFLNSPSCVVEPFP